jgi:PAP2 superfamily
LTFAQLAVQAFKFTSARQRPFVHFADPARPHETDDNMAFISGHSALAFSVATSAGMVAHRRRYQFEPVIGAHSERLRGWHYIASSTMSSLPSRLRLCLIATSRPA